MSGDAVPRSRVVAVVQWVVGVGAATAVVMLFTLGGADSDPNPSVSTSPSSSQEAAADPAVIDAGREVYIGSCQVCHGPTGQGASGPSLADVTERYPDPAAQLAVVAAGRNAMPGFAGRLDAEELDAVVVFTRQGFGGAGS